MHTKELLNRWRNICEANVMSRTMGPRMTASVHHLLSPAAHSVVPFGWFLFLCFISMLLDILGCLVISRFCKLLILLRFLFQYSVFKVQCKLGRFKALEACFHKLLNFQVYSVPARDRATFVARCIMSDTVEMEGFEPLTPCLQGRCSPN